MRLEGGSVIDVAADSTAEGSPSAANVAAGRNRLQRSPTGCVATGRGGDFWCAGAIGDARRATIRTGPRAVGVHLHGESGR
jgi:hypothetical protein